MSQPITPRTPSARRRRAWALLAGLGTIAAACSDDDKAAEPDRSTSTSVAIGSAGLAPQAMVAVCLTAGDQVVSDICTVARDGTRTVIRAGADGGTGVALSPDRASVAFISGGEARVIGVDGTDERATGLVGSRPEWFDDGVVGVVADDGATIRTVDVERGDVEVAVAAEDRPEGSEQSVIETFAVDPAGDRLVATLVTRGSGDGDADRFALVSVDLTTREVSSVLASTEGPIAYPDFSDQGILAVAIAADIHLVDEAAGTSIVVSPQRFIGIEPTWSSDGDQLAWLGDGVNGENGPATLFIAEVRPSPGSPLGLSVSDPVILVGSANQPFNQFPVFPDW